MSEATNLWYFQDVDLFEMLCPHKVKTMAERHKFNYFKKNDFVYFTNEKAKNIYMIANGRF